MFEDDDCECGYSCPPCEDCEFPECECICPKNDDEDEEKDEEMDMDW